MSDLEDDASFGRAEDASRGQPEEEVEIAYDDDDECDNDSAVGGSSMEEVDLTGPANEDDDW